MKYTYEPEVGTVAGVQSRRGSRWHDGCKVPGRDFWVDRRGTSGKRERGKLVVFFIIIKIRTINLFILQ